MERARVTGARAERARVLTPKLLAVVMLLAAVNSAFSLWYVSLTTWGVTGWFIGPVYMVLVFELLGRLSPKFRLNPAQMLILLLPLWYGAGKDFLLSGTGGETMAEALCPPASFIIRGLREPEFRVWAWDLTPSLIAPKDPVELEKVWRGLMPGEVINWAPWIAPLAFWSLWWIVTTLMIVVLVYTAIGPQTVEVERLVFPMSVPLTVLLSNAGTWIESRGKARSKLFDLADVKVKAFWVSFAASTVFLSLIPLLLIISGVVSPRIYYWGLTPLPLHAALTTAAVLPGATFNSVLIIQQAILMTLLPFDVLITCIAAWLIFWVVYPTVGVRLGLLPYSPGAPEGSSSFYGWRAPFPMKAFAAYGLTLGLGLLTLWQAKDAVRAALKGEGHDSELPVKQLLYLFAGLFVVWLALWTAAGGHPLVMTFIFILFVLWQIAIVRYYAEIWWHPPTIHDSYFLLTWPFGAMVGAWSWAPRQQNQALYIANMALVVHGQVSALTNNPWNMGYTAHTYKWARDLNVDLRDLLITLFAVAVVSWPITFIFGVWQTYHCGGYLKLNFAARHVVGNALDMGVRGFTFMGTLLQMPFWYHSLLATLGIATVFAIHFLRTRFAWFMINPTALAVTLWLPEYVWLAALIAFAIKSFGARVFGAKRYEEYAAYVAAGLCWGVGTTYTILGFFALFVETLPKFFAFFVP
jgi:hypothetical protein